VLDVGVEAAWAWPPIGVEFRDPRRIVRVRSAHRAPNQSWDDLDFNVYTNQKWGELSKSHAADILVHYPDGHTTKGLEAHIAELNRSSYLRRTPGSRCTL